MCCGSCIMRVILDSSHVEDIANILVYDHGVAKSTKIQCDLNLISHLAQKESKINETRNGEGTTTISCQLYQQSPCCFCEGMCTLFYKYSKGTFFQDSSSQLSFYPSRTLGSSWCPLSKFHIVLFTSTNPRRNLPSPRLLSTAPPSLPSFPASSLPPPFPPEQSARILLTEETSARPGGGVATPDYG